MIRRFYNYYPAMKQEAYQFRGVPNREVLYEPQNVCGCGQIRVGFVVVDTDTGEILRELILCSACEYRAARPYTSGLTSRSQFRYIF